jgi:Zn-dependent peptidase ImmA (M78 family)/DNA-binding XRE family transcriptional regulator
MIDGGRVKQVREMHLLTQADLADRIPNLTQSQLSRIEANRSMPDGETLALLAANLGVTTDFFNRDTVSGLDIHTPQLRSRSRLTERVKNAAVQWTRLIYGEYERLRQPSAAPATRLIPIRDTDVRDAAAKVRNLLGFTSSEPLPYLVLAAERIGVTVLGLPFSTENLDALCAWRGGEPVIGLLQGVPGDRLRFNVAHELGHLVLHHPGQAGRIVEAEADAFAAELLTPLDAISLAMPRSPTLSNLTMLKTQWGVSVKSLVWRARELGIIDADRATGLYRQISARGWNRMEPGHVPTEKPRAFKKLAEGRYGLNLNVQKLAADAGWSEELAFLVLDQHATAGELPHQPPAPRRAHARNVIALHGRAQRAANN